MSKTYQALKRAEAERARADNGRVVNGWAAAGSGNGDAGTPVEYQKIRVWLTQATAKTDGGKSALIVGCRSGNGGTTTAAMLAASLADSANRKVVVIDTNFRTSTICRTFGVEGKEGLGDVLSRGIAVESRLLATRRPNLFVLPGGNGSSCPPDVLEDEKLDACLAQLRQAFDFVILDGPPVLDFPDACALASKVDRIVLVVQADHTSVEDAQRAKRYLEHSGGRILGVVINRQKDYTPRVLRRLLGSSS